MKRLIIVLAILLLTSFAFAEVATKRNGSYANGFYFTEIIDSGTIGQAIQIPPMHEKRITVTVICESGSCKAQTTTSSDIDVINDSAVWEDWALGAVSGVETDVLTGQVTGIRAVSISGQTVIEIVY